MEIENQTTLFDIYLAIAPPTDTPQKQYPKQRVPDESWGDHLIPTGIAVQAYQIEIDPEVGHHNTGEGQDTGKVERPSAPKARY